MLKNEIRNMKIDVMNDALAKALLRSEEAREVVATFISKVAGIDKELLINANFVGGEIPKKKIYEKNKESDVMVLIDENHRIIVEINRNSTNYIFDKNSSYAMASIIDMTRPRNTRFPTVILINMDPNFAGAHDVEERRTFDMEDMRLTGKDEGEKEKQLEIAKKMLKDITDYNLITKYIGLTIKEIKQLK